MFLQGLLSRFIKKISIFFLLVVAISIHGAELVIQPTFKSLGGMPYLSLNKMRQKYNAENEARQKEMRQQTESYKNETLEVLFNLAARLPLDMQNLILLELFGGNQNTANKFSKMPLIEVLDDYAWSMEAIKKDKFIEFHNDTNWKPHVIFGLVKEFRAFESYLTLSSTEGVYRVFSGNFKALNDINKISQIFQKSIESYDPSLIKYKFRYVFTLKNFINHQDINQWSLLPFFLAPFLCAWMDQSPYFKSLDKDIFYLAARQTESGLLRYSTFGGFLRGFPAGFAARGLAQMVVYIFNNEAYLLPTLIAIFAVMKLGIFLDIPGIHTESPCLGAAYITGCYAAICSISNIIKMRRFREESVDIQGISELLSRKDVEII